MKNSLKSKTAFGMLWSAFGKISQYGLNFTIGIVVARILMPSDYGLVGMLAIFFAFSQIFIESGFSTALIQKKDRTDIDYSTIFYFNLFVGLVLYILLFIAAPLIAKFYSTPQLTVLTRVLSITILINSLTVVQLARLIIMMDFKTQALISLIAVFISGFFAINLAFQGFGVWALVIQSISDSIVRTCLLFYLNKWKPLPVFSITSFKQLFRFSSKLLGAGLIGAIVYNLYNVLIGRYFKAKDLGYYTNAKQYPDFLSVLITSMTQGVTFPVLASLQNERERMVAVYGRLMGMIVFIVIPALTLFALLSEPFVILFLTEKWMPIVPLMQWLCFARMIGPISSLNMNILNSIGRSDLYLKVDLSKFPVTLTILLLTVPFGLKAIVIGQVLTNYICFFINAYYPGKIFGYGALRQLKEMKSVILATFIMSVSIYCVTFVIRGDLAKLVFAAPIGISVFLLSAYLMKIKELNDVMDMVKSILVKATNEN